MCIYIYIIGYHCKPYKPIKHINLINPSLNHFKHLTSSLQHHYSKFPWEIRLRRYPSTTASKALVVHPETHIVHHQWWLEQFLIAIQGRTSLSKEVQTLASGERRCGLKGEDLSNRRWKSHGNRAWNRLVNLMED